MFVISFSLSPADAVIIAHYYPPPPPPFLTLSPCLTSSPIPFFLPDAPFCGRLAFVFVVFALFTHFAPYKMGREVKAVIVAREQTVLVADLWAVEPSPVPITPVVEEVRKGNVLKPKTHVHCLTLPTTPPTHPHFSF